MASNTPKIEMHSSTAICRLCGIAYGKLNGFFYRSYAQMYKGTGYLPICKTCTDKLYEDFLKESGDPEKACHQMCRKLNLYWNKDIYEAALKGAPTRTLVVAYITKVNVIKHQGKSYDDTLREFGMMWDIPSNKVEEPAPPQPEEVVDESDEIEIAEEIKIAWGPGYTNKQYDELEKRREYYIKELSAKGVDINDVGVAALLRQIVATEIDINKGRANGEDVDKKVNTLNTLLGSAMLKPSQKKTEADVSIENTPLGVWVWRYENELPLPKDENESMIKKFVHTWLYGHLGKMLGLRNSYTQLYEDEMERLRVERPEYADEDDDAILTDAFGKDVFDDG